MQESERRIVRVFLCSITCKLLISKKSAKAFAEKNGYAYWDLINSPSFSTIHKTKNKTLESITALGMNSLRTPEFFDLNDLQT